MPKENIFPLYLTGATQAVTATADWNGISSDVTCSPNFGAITFTVGNATIVGATVCIRRILAGANTVTVAATGITTNAVLLTENDSIQLIWTGSAWRIMSLSDEPATPTGTVTQGTNRTTGVSVTSKAGIITTDATSSGTANTLITFTVTNAFVNTGSVVMLTAGTNGTSVDKLFVTSIASGSFAVNYAYDTANVATALGINFLIA
jgi:hypothetical protein